LISDVEVCSFPDSFNSGEVSEWFKERAWKARVCVSAPGVRIPPSPPYSYFTKKWRISSKKHALLQIYATKFGAIMVIIITVKNFIKRSNIYYFRMAVPADCRDQVGQREITQSLKTSDELEAAAASQVLTKKWKKRFSAVRRAEKADGLSLDNKPDNTLDKFRQTLFDYVKGTFPDYLDAHTKKELVECSRFCRDVIIEASKNGDTGFELEHLLGISYPPPKQKTPGMTRKMNRVFVDILTEIRTTIDKELGEKISEKVNKEVLEPYPDAKVASKKAMLTSVQLDDQTDILAVANQMIDTKNIAGFFKDLVLTEITNLQEWCNGKSDLTTYTKADVVGYVRNCLPYIPKNRLQKGDYEGKSLKQCVKMTKANPDKYVPISHRTCENRFAGMAMVLNYAKEYLGIVPINLAKGIQIPQVRKLEDRPRAFTSEEIIDMWTALNADNKKPERYWVPVLALYHGFRQNEVCSLRLRDIYVHTDGSFVIDINDRGNDKSVKTNSSVRIVPVHPYVLNTLKFKDFVKSRKAESKTDDLLFPNLTYSGAQGYGRKISRWFNKWKTDWLKEGSLHKNFHSLRHTFIQQAQNQAKMPDRYTQEITGHSVTSVSSIHQGYSGRLQPKDVLNELKKIQYKLKKTAV
jgi:integrase